METGVAKIADDRDFFQVRELIDDDTNWKLDYCKSDIEVNIYFYFSNWIFLRDNGLTL